MRPTPNTSQPSNIAADDELAASAGEDLVHDSIGDGGGGEDLENEFVSGGVLKTVG